MKDYAIALDLGGTNLRIGAVDRSGEILSSSRSAIPLTNDAPSFFDEIGSRLDSFIRELNSDAKCLGCCLAIPSVFDRVENILVELPNLPFLNGYRLGHSPWPKLGVPFMLENDANAAALGENWKGASSGAATSVCFTLGTGVGGGIIIDGKALCGIDGTAGEIGHIVVEPDGFECGCGSWGCLEQYASATGVAKMIAKAVENGEAEPGYLDLPVSELFERAMNKDEFAISIFTSIGKHLGLAAAGLVNVLNPEVIVVAGGLSNAFELIAGPMQTTIRARAFKRPAERAKILKAQLGDNAGLIGAACKLFSETETARH